MNIRWRLGFDLSSDCWSSASDRSLLSSSQRFFPPPVEDTAFAIAMAGDMPLFVPGAFSGVFFAACIIALSESLIASASARALAPAVKEKTYCSEVPAGVFGGCVKILSITFGLLAGVCCRSGLNPLA